ncbi:NDK domain-containing protein, partial [Haematococcus lacustris]
VSLGLSAPWQGGRAGRLPALWELLHELGHGLHLLMAGRRCCWGQGGALGLPLELLEVPSTLCEHLLTCPASLSAICRYDPTASDPELSMLSVASHHQASFWCYVYASVLASAWWQSHKV